MTLIPTPFLFRFCRRIPYVRRMPLEDADQIVLIPPSGRIDPLASLAERKAFADLRMGWNEFGLGFVLEVKGKERAPTGDPDRLRYADGLTLWIDTRDSRTAHRASRYCHQFQFAVGGGGASRDEPVFRQGKINRALSDAPAVNESDIRFRVERLLGGYRLEIFLPAVALHGFDPEQHPRLGLHYVIRDGEHGEQAAGAGREFPYEEDPSLWDVVELVRADA